MKFTSTHLILALILLLFHFIACWTSNKCQISEDSEVYNLDVLNHPCPLYQNKTLRAMCHKIENLGNDFLDIPQNIQVLCFKGNANIIYQNAFSSFRQLVALRISLPICTIFSGAFSGLEKLEHLHIIFKPPYLCKTVTFASDMFLPLTSLKNLYLNGFHVSQDKQFMLPRRIQLDHFWMSNLLWSNLFDVFNVFQGIYSIKVLDLRNNNFQVVHDTYHLTYLKGSKPGTGLPFIKELNLSNNNITKVVPKSFSRMNVSSLIMGYNNFNLADLLISGLNNLDNLSLKNAIRQYQDVLSILSSLCFQFTLKSLLVPKNNIYHIEPGALKDCTSLEYIDLSHNNLEYLDDTFLLQLPQLKYLDLSRNGLGFNVCSKESNSTYDVQIFSFNYNELTLIEKNNFFCIPHLKRLMLKGNNIQMINSSAFLHLQELEWLDLSNNKLIYLDELNLPNLRYLNLEDNYMNSFYFKLPLLQNLKVKMSTEENPFVWLSPTFRELSVIAKYACTIILSNNSYSLQNFYVYSTFVFFTPDHNMNLSSVKSFNLHHNQGFHLPGNIDFSMFFPQLELLVYEPICPVITILNMSGLMHLKYLEVHNLICCNVNPENLFKNLPSLEVLKLMQSGIQYFTASFFKNMTSLKRLVIDQAYIITLSGDVQDHFFNLEYLYFFNVTFECDCLNAWLINWAYTTKKTFVSGLNCSCLKLHTKYSLFSFVEYQCLTDLQFILFVLTSGFIVLSTFVILLYNNKRSLLLHLMYIFWAWMRKTRGKKRECVKYDYDAFVSYSSLDQDWVIQNLIPNLEENGPPFLHLCLHNRDFEIGKDIVDNIMESIYRSRRIICLISRNYLRSDWCSLEMRMATYRLLSDQEDVLILVFLEHISRYQLSTYHRLAKMIKRKTYIEWPVDNDNQIAFWAKLRQTIENVRFEAQASDI